MLILGIETSGAVGSVALCEEESVLGHHRFAQGASHQGNIVQAVDSLLRRTGTDRRSIGAVAVSEGPGGFTGLRVGVTFAKMLAYALQRKAVGVPSLEVKVYNLDPSAADAREYACPVLDARRSCVYATVFRREANRWRDLTGVLVLPPQQAAESIPRGALVFGSGVRKYPASFPSDRFQVGPDELEEGRAEVVARLGLSRIRQGEDVSPMALVARYYRPTAPEEKMARRK